VLEEALVAGKTRALGTVNYCEKQLDCLLQNAKTKPAVNYYMFHAGMGPDAHGLRSYGEKVGVRTFGYGALGEPGPSKLITVNPVLGRIGSAHGRSATEVAIRWALQSGVAMSVRPTADFGMGVSACPEEGGACAAGLRERAAAFGWELTKREMAEIDALDSPDGVPAIFSSACNPDRIGI
jgi:diketogulonate reductase-like aldo/keto reductase